jgi:hypothetical protein
VSRSDEEWASALEKNFKLYERLPRDPSSAAMRLREIVNSMSLGWSRYNG